MIKIYEFKCGGGLVAKSCDPMDCTFQAPLSVGFSRQEYWSALPFSPPGDLSDNSILNYILHS